MVMVARGISIHNHTNPPELRSAAEMARSGSIVIADTQPNIVPTSKADVHVNSKEFQCSICGKNYTSYKTMRVHVKNFHPAELGNLTPPRANKVYKFKCDLCGYNFNRKAHLNHHMRNAHNLETTKQFVACITCGLQIEKKKYVDHLQLEHSIQIETVVVKLSSMQDFYSWKKATEKETKENFITERGARNFVKKKVYYFHCHRSGFQNCHSENKIILRRRSSKKINGFCPANMKLICFKETNKFEVHFRKTHFGHSNDAAFPSEAYISDLNIVELSNESNSAYELKRKSIPSSIDINERKEKLKLRINVLIENLKSEKEIQIFEKHLNSVKTTIDAICINNPEQS